MKKLLAALLAAVLVLTSGIVTVFATQSNGASTLAATQPSGLATRTKEEIIQKYQDLMPDLNESITNVIPPSATAPYEAGQISDLDLQAGLDMVNLIRFVAGLQDNVTLDAAYTSQAQHASVLVAANDALSHAPAKPSGMEDTFYNLGYQGAASSNLGAGYRNPAASVLQGYMDDSDVNNLPMMGHRRWVLDPAMGKTGFGFIYAGGYGSYTAMRTMDTTYQSARSTTNYVAWPAPLTPIELYQYTPAFNVTFYSRDYEINPADIKVNIYSTLEKTNYTFATVSDATQLTPEEIRDLNNPLFVNSDSYGGTSTSIIFMPATSGQAHRFAEGDTLEIYIYGIKQNGAEIPFEYTVELFSAENPVKTVTAIAVDSTGGTVDYIEGQTFSLSGLNLKVTYSDGSNATIPLTEDMLANLPDMNTVGQQNITVTYEGQTTTLTVNISAKQPQSMTLTPPTKLTYKEGEALDLTGASLQVTYNDGTNSTVTVTEDMVTGYDANQTGQQTLTVTYGTLTETFNVTVNARQLKGIQLIPPNKLTYQVGEALDLTGATLLLTYDNSTTDMITVTPDMVSGYNSATEGVQTLTVTYNGFTENFDVTVSAKQLRSIAVTPPTKTIYKVGEALDLTGASLLLTYDDQSTDTIPVTENMITGYDPAVTGLQQVTVSYGNFTDTFEVTVNAKQLHSIAVTPPTKTTYKEGEALDLTGASLLLTYNDGTTETMALAANTADVVITGYDAAVIGPQTVTVSYGSFTTTFTITVNESNAPQAMTGTPPVDTAAQQMGAALTSPQTGDAANHRFWIITAAVSAMAMAMAAAGIVLKKKARSK